MRISDWSSDVCSSDLFGRRIDLFHDERKRIAHAGIEQRLALGDERVEFGQEIGHFASFATASASWPIVSSSGSMFKGRTMSHSSSIAATRSITVSESSSRSRAKLTVSPSTTPFLLKGSMSSRSEEHTSELQSLMRISYAVFCLKNKTHTNKQ